MDRHEEPSARERYGDALPLALLVFDAAGVVVHCNDRLRTLVNGSEVAITGDGSGPVDPIGMNVLDLVHPDDHDYAVELVTHSLTLPGRAMGPIRLRYLTSAGEIQFTDLWVENLLDDPEIAGHVVLITEESTQHRFVEAVTRIAAGEPIESVLATVAASMAGHPMRARGVIVGRRADGSLGPLHATDLPPELTGALPGGPWDQQARSASEVDTVDIAALAPRVASVARAGGLAAVWGRTIDGAPPGTTLLCWRREPGVPSPNQRTHIEQAVEIVGLAFTQDDQRRSLERLAYTDPLTGLANRARLDGFGSMDLDGVAVLYVDLDDFKDVNDKFGHEVGDLALKHVATCLRAVIRRGDEVVRLGGDEFVVICRPPCAPDDLSGVAKRLIEAVTAPVDLAGNLVSLGAGVGIVHHRDHRDLEQLIQEADAALYLAKAKGRSKWWMAPLG